MNSYSDAELQAMYRYTKDKKLWLNEIGPALAGCSRHELKVKLGLAKPKENNSSYWEPWTKEEDKKLKSIYSLYGINEVAQMMGRSKCAIQNRVKFLKLRKTKIWHEGNRELLKEMLDEGKSNAEIAKRFGTSYHAIAQMKYKIQKGML